MCDKRRLRPACAYAQSDQSLCWSLEYSMTVELLTNHHLEFLSLIGGCTGSSESTLVKMPHCWKSHVVAQFPLLDMRAEMLHVKLISKCKYTSKNKNFEYSYPNFRKQTTFIRFVLKWWQFLFERNNFLCVFF